MRKLFALTFVLFIACKAMATQGMWLPLLLQNLNEDEMKGLGMQITAEDIYSINHTSLKDAVVSFGGFCTGEVISSQGLVLTNHHCGYGAVQAHSSVEHDYLTDGYWASDQSEELPNPDLHVTFIVRMENVTDQVLKGIKPEISEEKRAEIIQKHIAKIRKKAIRGTHYQAIIKPFYKGNEYYMFVTETFNDVRLVGAPPSSIGKFGGDTDNWMWPRHTGDFSIFRIYADKNNNPAPYSEDNVPYKPKHHFPISLTGGELGDFTMVYGFPGSTEQYLTSYAVDMLQNDRNPLRIDFRELWLNTVDADMKKSDKVRIQYAAKYAGISNYHKKWIGENRGLKRLNAVQKKQELEADFMKLVKANPEWNKAYGSVLTDLKTEYDKIRDLTVARDIFIEIYYRMLDMAKIGRSAQAFLSKWDEKNKKMPQEAVDKFKKALTRHFKDFNPETERKLIAVLMKKYATDVKFEKPMVILTINENFKGDYQAFADAVIDNSLLANELKIMALLENYNEAGQNELLSDIGMALSVDASLYYDEKIRPAYNASQEKIELLMRTYVKALREVFKDKRFYPDANSTLRVAYGQVDDYEPRDAVFYKHYTTLDGVMEKYNPKSEEFNVPDKLIELWKNKDYGQYAYKGELRVCFTASNHTTGGNSGSPVIDAYGNLLGCNFDRNWEGTMSDVMYDPEMCRNITCDIRYVLFIVDKFAGATHLIDELTLVKPNYKRAIRKDDIPIRD